MSRPTLDHSHETVDQQKCEPRTAVSVDRLAVLVGVLGACLLFYLNAWVADDAYITFRSVEQLFAGHGPNFNPHERAQSFTHPAWFLLLCATRVVSEDLWANSMVVSLVLTFALLWLSRRLITATVPWVLFLAALATSRAFVDYLWSGLENPLTAVGLLALALSVLKTAGLAPTQAFPGQVSLFSPFLVSLLATNLVVLCRPDAILLCLPAVIWLGSREVRNTIDDTGSFTFIGLRSRRWLLGCVLGLLPIVLWAASATFYYGSPLPNTFYAKLATGLDPGERWLQGLRYFQNLLKWDPWSVVLIGSGLWVGLRKSNEVRTLALGVLLHVAWVVKSGGDFMAGRFYFGAVLFCALMVARQLRTRNHEIFAAGLCVFALWFQPASSLFTQSDYRPLYQFSDPSAHGIADEKGYYFSRSSLRRRLRGTATGFQSQFPPDRKVLVARMIGEEGYSRPTSQILIDRFALADPFLARLKAAPDSRVGHFERALPEGYQETVESGQNQLRNPTLAKRYDLFSKVARGRLLASGRLRAIWTWNFGLRPLPCQNPPFCRPAVVHEIGPQDFTPLVNLGTGTIFDVTAKNRRLTVSGDVGGPPIDGGRTDILNPASSLRFHIVTPTRPEMTRLDHPPFHSEFSGAPGAFELTLRYGGRAEALRAKDLLCLAIQWQGSRGEFTDIELLSSSNPHCSQLLTGD